MLQHGELVHKYYCDILNLITDKVTKFEWDIPEQTISQLSKLYIDAMLSCQVKDYHTYHDCGKHISKYVDDEGRQHFPDHADNSYRQWLEHGGDGITAYLIQHDMYFHTTPLPCIEAITYYPTLLLTAWAEIHANSEMFGGVQSTSFKIKKKRLIKITNKLTK